VADEAVAFDFDAEEECVLVAVGGDFDDAEAIAAGFAFHPEFLAGAAPKCNKAGFFCFAPAFFVEKSEHEDLAGARILHDAGGEAVHFGKVDGYFGHPDFLKDILAGELKSPSALRAPAGFSQSWCPALFTLECESSPARSSRDDGGDDDGGGELTSQSPT
jgi:hypothetical protein